MECPDCGSSNVTHSDRDMHVYCWACQTEYECSCVACYGEVA